MPVATKICRVCGKEYEACHTAKVKAGSFRWQDVSCSPECGAIYLAKILESRGEVVHSPKETEPATDVIPGDTDAVEKDAPSAEEQTDIQTFRNRKRKKYRK